MPSWALVVLACAATVFSGCAGSSAKGTGTTDPTLTAAPPPTVDDQSGSITGTVLDEEAVPIARGEVVVLPSGAKVKTDASGSFTINDVAPGTHTLFATALGYESASRRVDVLAGEVKEVRFTLKSVAVLGEPFVNVHPSVFYMTFGWWGSVEIVPQTRDELCDPCETYQSVGRGPVAGLMEADWTKSVPAPAFSDTVWINLYTKPTNGSLGVGGTHIGGAEFSPREAYPLPEAGIEKMAKADLTMTQAYSPWPYQFAVQQKFYSWTSLGYHAELQENYTALPPR